VPKPGIMPLDVAAYIADTFALSTQEHGAYMLLLMASWQQGGPLPDDDALLARLVRASGREWKKLRASLAPFFHVVDGEWRQKRLLTELERVKARQAIAEGSVSNATLAKWGDMATGDRGRLYRSMRLKAAREKGTHTAEQWEVMRAFHCGKCVRCGSESLEIVRDHIVPLYQGGSDGIDNFQPLCRSCNAAKGPEAVDYRWPGWDDACLDACTAGNEQATSRPPQKEVGPLSLSLEALDSSKPIPKTKIRKEKKYETPIPENFAVSTRVRAWADRKGIADLEPYLEIFVGRHVANGKTYIDWDQAFMNAIREDWYGIRKAKPGNGNGAGIVPDWWASDTGTKQMGEKLGMSPRGGESWNEFRGRIRERLRQSH
jgi:uncharacterized protein YdaU (DUF1376 family)